MKKRFYLNQFASLILLATVAGFSTHAIAGGFQLYDQNITNLGNAFAGVSAQADDASTESANPAGMTRLDGPEITASGEIINI